jgi:ABC-type phosphate transport system substrate-binding protein
MVRATRFWIVPALFALRLAPSDVQAEPVVVVSVRSPVKTLSGEQVARIFLGKTETFPGGQRAVPIDQSEGSAVRDQFYDQVVNKTPAQLKAYWSRIIFSGRGEPPRSEPDDGAVKRRLQQDARAIGYIDHESLDPTVRLVYPRGN